MKKIIKRTVERLPFYPALRRLINKRRERREVLEWEHVGRQGPPPHPVKQRALLYYSEKYGLKVLVETGTYQGAMVEAMKRHFDHVFSIELSKELYEAAKKRFKKDTNVEIIQGDSGSELANLMPRIKHPALFWLDGHYSSGSTAKGVKETPIFEELDHLLRLPEVNHVVVIDDARLFGHDPQYPTLDELKLFVLARRANVEFLVKDDSIRITPK